MTNGAGDKAKAKDLLQLKHKRKYMMVDGKFVIRGISYSLDIPNKLVKYFDIEPFVKKEDGTVDIANLPTLVGFCAKYKINRMKFYNWVKAYPEMKEAYDFAKMKEEEILVANGLRKHYDPTFAKFIAMNNLGMSEKKEVTNNVETTDEQKRKMIAEYIMDMKLKESNVIEGEVVGEVLDGEDN